ncbi:hypothetical protein sos41_11930 [Alphaproteobacteria bacterium SO-S41]|nr:hypothetical protein sos41_11930 [Alphaproteobacteria bacterium SO-S41]
MPLDREARAREGADPIIALAIVSHPNLDPPVRVAANGEDVESNGETFFGWPWQLKRPDEGEDAANEAEVTIDNIDPAIVTALIGSIVKPEITIQLILASSPDDVEQELASFKLTDIRFDGLWIKGTLSLPDLRVAPVCCKSFTPSVTPGVF